MLGDSFEIVHKNFLVLFLTKQKAPGRVTVFPLQTLFIFNLLLTHNYKIALLIQMSKGMR